MTLVVKSAAYRPHDGLLEVLHGWRLSGSPAGILFVRYDRTYQFWSGRHRSHLYSTQVGLKEG